MAIAVSNITLAATTSLYTVPAGKRLTANLIVHAVSGGRVRISIQQDPATAFEPYVDDVNLSDGETFERTGLVLDAGETVAIVTDDVLDVVAQLRGFEENV